MMNTTLKTRDEIVLETLETYLLHPDRRSVAGEGVCLYDGPEGKECAFARCVRPDQKHLLKESTNAASYSYLILKPEYQIDDPNFWDFIQDIHDNQLPVTSEEGFHGLREHIKNYPLALAYLEDNVVNLNIT